MVDTIIINKTGLSRVLPIVKKQINRMQHCESYKEEDTGVVPNSVSLADTHSTI